MWVTGADMDVQDGEDVFGSIGSVGTEISPPSQPSPIEGEGAFARPSADSARTAICSHSALGKPYLMRCLAASRRWQNLASVCCPCMVSTRNAAIVSPLPVRLWIMCCIEFGRHMDVGLSFS